jgi:tetratricopeptide (TPR) repeat protein
MRVAPSLFVVAGLSAHCLVAVAQSAFPERDVLTRGAALEERGEYRQAKALYLEGLGRFPRSGEIAFRIGTLYLREGDMTAAIRSLQQASDLRPRHVDTLYYLAQAYYLDGQHEPARERLLRALALEPGRAEIAQKYGEYLCEDRGCAEGLRYLLKAQRLDPTLPDIEFDIGMAHLRLAAIADAERHLEIAVENDPGNMLAARFLADTLGREYRWDRARDLYKLVIAREPRNARALYGLGQALLALGDAEGAVTPLREALAADPTIAEAHFQLARAFRQVGRRDEADQELGLFKALRGRRPGSDSALRAERTPAEERMWDECRRLLREGREADALAYLESLSPSTQPSSYLLGALYFELGRSADAVRLLARADAQSPEDPDILALLGRAYVADGNLEAAEPVLARARASRPDGELALIGAGELELARRRWDQAIRHLEDARTIQVPALLKLCRAYLAVGDKAKALETAELVRAFGRDDPASLRELDSLLAGSEDRGSANP